MALARLMVRQVCINKTHVQVCLPLGSWQLCVLVSGTRSCMVAHAVAAALFKVLHACICYCAGLWVL